MKKTMRSGFWMLLAGGLGYILLGCNTVDGVGKDMESAGEAIQDAAD
jgi:predicted small secreted protein